MSLSDTYNNYIPELQIFIWLLDTVILLLHLNQHTC